MAFKYQSGIGNSAAYMVSGTPWITGSADIGVAQEVKVEFPRVTNSFTVIASGSGATPKIRVHFNSTSSAATTGNGGLVHGPGSANVISAHHYIQLDGDEESMNFPVKCKEVYITALNAGSGFQLFAALTGIDAGAMYDLTGSGLTTDLDNGTT